MVTVHFICGSIGAGKTSYAVALARRIGAVRLSTDEWMTRLFPANRLVAPALAWNVQLIERCELQMWTIAEQLVARGVHVVFDLAPSGRDHRDRMRGLVAQTRAESKLHYLDVNRATRRARVLERNRQHALDSIEVSEEMFDRIDGWFEPPTDDELYGAMIVCEE